MVNKRADTGIYDLWDAPNKQERTHDLTIWYCKKQIVVIYSCICPVTENEFRQNIAKGVWGSTARVLWRNSWLMTGQTHEENVNLLSANRTLILFFFFFLPDFDGYAIGLWIYDILTISCLLSSCWAASLSPLKIQWTIIPNGTR